MTSVLSFAVSCRKCGAPAGERCVNLDGSTASGSHMNRTPTQPCGSYGGYQRHKKVGEKPCDPCREANRRYHSRYRDANPEKRQADIDLLAARREATRRLIELHRDDFDTLLTDVLGASA